MVSKQKFSIWINKFHKALYNHAYWMVGDSHLAADLVQETFYRGWQGCHRLQQKENPFPWFMTILRRTVFKELAQRRAEQEASSWDGNDMEQIASSETAHLLADLARALQRLDTNHREVLLLHCLHGFSYQEISSQLDIPMGTVMSRIARARQALREHISDDAVAQWGQVIQFPVAVGEKSYE